MKKALFLFLLLAGTLAGCRKDNDPNPIANPVPTYECEFVDFKYYYDKKEFFGKLVPNYILLGFDTTYSNAQIESFIRSRPEFDQDYKYSLSPNPVRYKFRELPLRLTNAKSCEQITGIIHDLQKLDIVSYVHYTTETEHCLDYIGESMGNLCIVSYGSSFHVKIKDKNNLAPMYNLITQTGTEMVGPNQFMGDVYEIRATKSANGDALKMANRFQESGLFNWSEPGVGKFPVE